MVKDKKKKISLILVQNTQLKKIAETQRYNQE